MFCCGVPLTSASAGMPISSWIVNKNKLETYAAAEAITANPAERKRS
jgi:hypothetical protein